MTPLIEVVNKLLSWDVLKSHGIRDVLVDEDRDVVALVGPPLKLEINLIKPQFVRNVDYNLNTSFAAHFGIPINVTRWPNSYRVQGTRPMWFHGLTDGNSSGEHLEDFLSNLSSAIRDAILQNGHDDIGEEVVRVVLLSDPGFPFEPGVTTHVYSAKNKKSQAVSMPAYATEIKNRDGEKVMGVDFCKLLPVVCADGAKTVVGALADGVDFLVTHSSKFATDLGKLRPDYAEIVKRCPGMLFPSLATGLIPATNFGETVLVVRPNTILSSMAPYKERGAFSVVTFNTDVWTETAGAFVSEISEVCWKQLHGDVNWYYTSHLYVLGPSIKDTGFGGEDAKIITSTKSLGSNMRKKFKKWTRDISFEKFKQLSDLPSGERYAYLESKLNIILGWDCIPLAVCPEQIAKQVAANLGQYGFVGKVLAVPIEEEMFKAIMGEAKGGPESEYLVYQYAWIVRDVIVEYAKKNNQFFSVSD